MVERWESPDALRVHGKAEALTTLGHRLAGRLTGAPEVRRLSPVPAGDAVKGAV
jgi:quinol monooxygenase YgiN